MNLKTIAKELGISPSTVSRVVNGKKNFSVSDELREKIMERVNAVGYSPNPMYQSMRQKQNFQISALLPNFLSKLSSVSIGLDCMRETLLSNGFSLHYLLHTLEDGKKFPLPPWKVAGAVVVDIRTPELISLLNESKIPYVSLNGATGSNGTAVITDDTENMRIAMDYLHHLGHRNIGYINHYRSPDNPLEIQFKEQHYSIIQRTNAYQKFCNDFGLTVLEESMDCNTPLSQVLDAGLNKGVTAFIAYQSSIAVEVEFLLKERGLRIPEDISLITFDNTWMLPFMDPPITCVEIPLQKMGKQAATILIEKKEHPEHLNGETIACTGKLIERKSTGPVKNG